MPLLQLSAREAIPPEASDASWKKLTERANEARRAGDAGARALYEAALIEAERVFQAVSAGVLPDEAPLAPLLYNISCHNLAQQLLDAGDVAPARAALELAFGRLVAACASSSPPSLRTSCARHLQVAVAALAQHLVECGAREQAEDCVRRANAAILSVLELARASSFSEV